MLRDDAHPHGLPAPALAPQATDDGAPPAGPDLQDARPKRGLPAPHVREGRVGDLTMRPSLHPSSRGKPVKRNAKSLAEATATGPTPSMLVVVEEMVHCGATLEEACRTAGIRTKTAREHLRAPRTAAYLQEQLKARAALERVRALHALAELRDSARSEKVQLEAAKALYQREDERQPIAGGQPVVPGYVIVLQPPSAEPRR